MEAKREFNSFDNFQKDTGKETVFPYNVKCNPRSCYFVVFDNGQTAQFGRCTSDKHKNRELFDAVCSCKAKLFVSWVGNWRTDLFQITDLDRFEAENKTLIF